MKPPLQDAGFAVLMGYPGHDSQPSYAGVAFDQTREVAERLLPHATVVRGVEAARAVTARATTLLDDSAADEVAKPSSLMFLPAELR